MNKALGRFRGIAAAATAFVFVGLVGLAPPPAFAQADTDLAPADAGSAGGGLEEQQDAILLNFESADIREVIYTFAAALEVNYWLDPRVQGQVTARSFGPIFLDDLFPVFLQILRSNGFAAVKQGELYMIVPAEDGKTKAKLGSPDGSERFVVDLVKVTHVSADKVVELLNPFVSPGGDVTAYPRNNLVIITDLSSNSARLRDLIRTFDNDTFSDMTGRVYRIEHASVEDIGAEVQTILEGYQAAESGSAVHLIPLVRLNALAVIGFDPAVFAAVEYWLGVLDVPGSGGTERRVFVYTVENSKAVDLAEVLNEVYSGLSEEGEGDTRGRSGALAERGLGLGGGVDQAQRRNQSNRPGQQQRTPAQVKAQLTLGGSGEGVGSALFEQEIRIVADEITNALVILATPRDYQTIRSVLQELDIVPRQVLIEMVIAEIDLDDNYGLGVNTEIGNGTSGTGGNGGTGSPDADPGSVLTKAGLAMLSPAAAASTLFKNENSNRIDGSIGSSGINATLNLFDGDLKTTLVALSTMSKGTILSRPHIMTADNQEARILVGQEVPIVTSQGASDVNNVGGNSNILQNIQYRDTGVVVSVTPQVNSQGLVNMVVSQEVSQVVEAGGAGDVDGIVSPTFTTREAETTVVVQSGETIVIGGIIQEIANDTSNGVPFFKDIPVLGQFFRSKSNRTRRTELIVLITPYVVRDANEARTVTAQFKARVDDVLQDLQSDGEFATGESHTSILQKPVF